MRYAQPSKIQGHALPLLLRDPPEHLIAQSQTGTGKTAAFSLAILSRIDCNDPSPQVSISILMICCFRPALGLKKLS